MRDVHGMATPMDATIETTTIVNGGVDDMDDMDDGERSDEYNFKLPEDKFRVDRKKLEQMLLGNNVDVRETAENFFKRIMDETNTVVTWPSKLKIGAKSKKDPHIKVSGQPDDIRLAKSKIYAVLDMKSSRVTLKMDVAHTDHSHIIGRRGNNIQEVMRETGCHIHFPDSNRSNPIEKSNQVSISGQPKCVETARTRIRGMLPLNFTFDVPATVGFLPVPDLIAIKTLETNYEVKVQFRRNPKTCVTGVHVRGCETNAFHVMEATFVLAHYLYGDQSPKVCVEVRTTLEIGPQHYAKVKEQVESERIAQKTGTTIAFHDANQWDMPYPNRSTVTISGVHIEGVHLARWYLMGCLPLFLVFDLKEGQCLHDVSSLMYQFNVSISVRPRPRMLTKGIIIRGIEREATRMYEARRLLLDAYHEGPPMDGAAFCALPLTRNYDVPSLSGMPSCTSILGSSLLTANPTSAILPTAMTNPRLPLPLVTAMNGSDGRSHRSYSTQGQQTAAPRIISQGPGFHYGPRDPPHVGYHNHPSSIATSSQSSLSAPSSTTSSLSSPSESPPRGSPIDTAAMLAHQGYSRDTLIQLLVKNNDDIIQGQNRALNMLAAFTGMNSVGSQESFSATSESSDSETVVPDKDRSWTLDVLDGTLASTAVTANYDVKRVLAAKAMKLKPEEPEVRVPTSLWSGYGFSHSMPEAAIRELRQRDRLAFEMNGNLTLDPGQLDKDPWRDRNVMDGVSNSDAVSVDDEHSMTYEDGGGVEVHQRIPVADGVTSLGSSNYIDSASLPKSSSTLMTKCTDLTDLLRMLGLSKYYPLFKQQEVDLDTFVTLSDQDLKDLEITMFGARRKMLLAISNLKQQQSTVFSMAPGAERKLSATTKNNSSDSDVSSNGATAFWQ